MFDLDAKRSSTAVLAGLCGFTAAGLLVVGSAQVSPVMAGLAVCGLLVAAAILLSPALGLLLTAAVIPIERIGRLTSDSSMYTVSLMRIVGLLALGSFVIHAVTRKWKLRFGKPFFLYLAYCGLAVGTVFYTSDQLGTIRSGSAILGNLVFLFLVVNVVRNWRLAKAALLVWLASSVLIGIYTMYDWHTGHAVNVERIGELQSRFSTVYGDTAEWQQMDEVLSRAVGPTSAAAVYGINMILTLPFFAFLIRIERDWRVRLGILTSVLIVLYNIFLANTRAAMLVTIAVLALCVVRKLIAFNGKRLALVALILVTMVLAAPSAIYDRVFKPGNYTYAGSSTLRSRLDYWNAALLVADKHWLGGAGLGNQNEVPKYLKGPAPEQTSAHNEFLQTLDEVGIFGWLAFFSFVAVVLAYGFRGARYALAAKNRELYWFLIACQIAMISVLLYAFQADVFHFPLKGWWLVAGLTWVTYQLTRQLSPKLAQATERAA